MFTGKFYRVWLALVLCTVLMLPAGAQETFITVTGLLKDRQTGEKINYATVSVPGTGIGTVSNSDGEFTLKVSPSLAGAEFEVSHLSYATARFSIEEAAGKANTFFLDLRPVQLKEVPVIPEDAAELVALALRKVRENYSQEPVRMSGFYRESVRQRRGYLSIAEAVVDIYKAPYSGFQQDQVRIFKGRKSASVKPSDTLLVKLQGGPKVLMMLDIMKNPDLGIALSDLGNYRFISGPLVNIDDRLHRVIVFTPAVELETPLYYGKLYISADDIAITRAEFSLDLGDEEKAAQLFVRSRPEGLLFLPTSTGYLVTYKEQDGIYYLNYVRVDLKFRCDWKKKLFRNNYTIVSEAAITGRSAESAERFTGQEVFRSDMVFSEKVGDLFDAGFWGGHNIIDPEESIESAIRKLARSMED